MEPKTYGEMVEMIKEQDGENDRLTKEVKSLQEVIAIYRKVLAIGPVEHEAEKEESK